MELQATFQRRIIDVYGEEGRHWLDALPQTIDACSRRWRLRLEPPFHLSYNYAAPALRDDGTAVVLKIGVPGVENASEIAALRHFAGIGSVLLLDADPANGAMLLERADPGEPLMEGYGALTITDPEATLIAAGVMRALWKSTPAGHAFPTAGDWAAQLLAATPEAAGPLPPRLVTEAQRLYVDLLASSAPPVLLHGDLHHGNILRHGEGWIAIDPKGVIGEPAYECGPLLFNPLPEVASWPDLPRVLGRRVDILADALGFERERIIGWGIARAVLSAVWSYEGHGSGWEPAIAIAEALEAISS